MKIIGLIGTWQAYNAYVKTLDRTNVITVHIFHEKCLAVCEFHEVVNLQKDQPYFRRVEEMAKMRLIAIKENSNT